MWHLETRLSNPFWNICCCFSFLFFSSRHHNETVNNLDRVSFGGKKAHVLEVLGGRRFIIRGQSDKTLWTRIIDLFGKLNVKIRCVLYLHYNGNSHLNDMEIQNKTFYSQRVWIGYNIELRHGKMGNKKRTCLATLVQNELNSDVACFTTHIKPVLQQIRLLKGLNVGGKTRNIVVVAKQVVRFLLPVFPYL